MTLRSSIAALVILAATASWGWGQNSAGPLASRRQTATASPNSDAQMASARAKSQLEAKQHIDEMGATLSKMHTLLKQMRAKTSVATSKDSVAKANLDMWSMMLDQLDKQYDQMVAAQKAREDMEARRLAMYRQADEKAAAAAAAARAAQMAKAAEQANAGNAASAPAAATQPATAPAQSPAAPATAPAATSSPN